jgi:hypothetical protein
MQVKNWIDILVFLNIYMNSLNLIYVIIFLNLSKYEIYIVVSRWSSFPPLQTCKQILNKTCVQEVWWGSSGGWWLVWIAWNMVTFLNVGGRVGLFSKWKKGCEEIIFQAAFIQVNRPTATISTTKTNNIFQLLVPWFKRFTGPTSFT